MIKQILIIFSIVLLSAQVYAQPPDTLWTRTFGGAESDIGFGVQQTDDFGHCVIEDSNGDYIITGLFNGEDGADIYSDGRITGTVSTKIFIIKNFHRTVSRYLPKTVFRSAWRKTIRMNRK